MRVVVVVWWWMISEPIVFAAAGRAVGRILDDACGMLPWLPAVSCANGVVAERKGFSLCKGGGWRENSRRDGVVDESIVTTNPACSLKLIWTPNVLAVAVDAAAAAAATASGSECAVIWWAIKEKRADVNITASRSVLIEIRISAIHHTCAISPLQRSQAPPLTRQSDAIEMTRFKRLWLMPTTKFKSRQTLRLRAWYIEIRFKRGSRAARVTSARVPHSISFAFKSNRNLHEKHPLETAHRRVCAPSKTATKEKIHTKRSAPSSSSSFPIASTADALIHKPLSIHYTHTHTRTYIRMYMVRHWWTAKAF